MADKIRRTWCGTYGTGRRAAKMQKIRCRLTSEQQPNTQNKMLNRRRRQSYRLIFPNTTQICLKRSEFHPVNKAICLKNATQSAPPYHPFHKTWFLIRLFLIVGFIESTPPYIQGCLDLHVTFFTFYCIDGCWNCKDLLKIYISTSKKCGTPL